MASVKNKIDKWLVYIMFFFGLHQFFFSLEKDIMELVKALQIWPAHLTVIIMHMLFFSTPLKI